MAAAIPASNYRAHLIKIIIRICGLAVSDEAAAWMLILGFPGISKVCYFQTALNMSIKFSFYIYAVNIFV